MEIGENGEMVTQYSGTLDSHILMLAPKKRKGKEFIFLLTFVFSNIVLMRNLI